MCVLAGGGGGGAERIEKKKKLRYQCLSPLGFDIADSTGDQNTKELFFYFCFLENVNNVVA